MKNRKGVAIGTLLMVFIAILVALVIFTGSITRQVGETTNLGFNPNQTIDGFTYGSVHTLQGKSVSNVYVTNGSKALSTNNYTILNNQVVNDELVAQINLTHVGPNVNVSYNYQGYGYADDSGTRVITGLIIVFSALAIVVIVLIPAVKEWI